MLMSNSGHASIPTGGGKTHVIVSLTRRLPAGKKVVIVPTSEILIQMHKLLEMKHQVHISRLGGGLRDIQSDSEVLVATFQTLCSRISSNDEFVARFLYDTMAAIVDECHHCPCDSIQSIMRASRTLEYQYGLSATPWRTDGQDIVMEGQVGPLVYEVPPKFLVDRGYITPGVVFMANVSKGSKFGAKKGDYSVIYRDLLVGFKPRRDLEVAACRQALMLGMKTMCFVKQVRHGQDLYDAVKKDDPECPISMLTGDMSSKERRGVLDKLRDGSIRLVIATLGKEGLDVPSIDAVILAGGGTDPSQEVGRALRSMVGKTTAYVWDFYDYQHPALQKQARMRYKWYEETGIFTVKRT